MGYLRVPQLESAMTMVYLEPVGTGASGAFADPNSYTIDNWVRHLRAVAQAVSSEPVFVLGHSHGGFVAQALALSSPELVAGLLLYATSPVADDEFGLAAHENFLAFLDRHPERPAEELAAMAKAVGEDSAPDLVEQTRMFRQIFPAYFADYWAREEEFRPGRENVRLWPIPSSGWLGTFDVRSRLGEIAVPTQILVGEHDFICGPRWGEILRKSIPGAEYELFARSGHLMHLEEPEAFTRRVADFVYRVG